MELDLKTYQKISLTTLGTELLNASESKGF